ncbi:MAG: transcriptional regulator [Elusimicrobia bacterium]|nr:transcriptional regulator [Elusimicrobiota bacterium]
MSGFIPPSELDQVIHERVRLGIVSALAAAGELTFVELCDLLKLTPGNLSVHSRVLEKAGYLLIDKEFVDRKPRTTLKLSAKGKEAFRRYLERLEEFVKGRK